MLGMFLYLIIGYCWKNALENFKGRPPSLLGLWHDKVVDFI